MEKRFVVFILLTTLVLTAHVFLRAYFAPPPVNNPELAETPAGEAVGVDPVPPPEPEVNTLPEQPPAEETPDEPVADEKPARTEAQRISLGTFQGRSDSPYLVTLNSRGAAIERIELTERDDDGRLVFRNLDNTSGYFGHLGLETIDGQGCRVTVVGDETPAALAEPADNSPRGLRVGDVITKIVLESKPPRQTDVLTPLDVQQFMGSTQPGQTVRISVTRPQESGSKALEFKAVLTAHPFDFLRPEPINTGEPGHQPLSMLMSFWKIGDHTELDGIRSPSSENWEVVPLEDGSEGVEFRLRYTSKELEPFGVQGPLVLIKRYRLGATIDGEQTPYHLDFDIELLNEGSEPINVGYHLDGPNGLPLEGWWYLTKIHTEWFASAGARDVVINTVKDGHLMFGTSAIYKKTVKNEGDPAFVLFSEGEEDEARTFKYLGVDTQYFLGALIPDQSTVFRRGTVVALGDLEALQRNRMRTTNTSFTLESQAISVAPETSYSHEFTFFAGPKRTEILDDYGLEETIYYGLFGWVAKPLARILHFFYGIVGNYGIAIIMLTILVRSLMFPLSRQAAKNAAMMQELAPEMKKITEKYKADMEKRARAQQELFRRHNYNPLGGCWMMLVQLPIFLGLYRSLAVDVELRQAAFIPGIDWCSNLAGPDMLFYWGNFSLFGLTSPTGLLGPYFNLLPIFTIILFLMQQKLFTPPATDDQTRMQMQMMKFMTIFIGIMFFKVASGLCLYFIASSIWGIAERKLIPRPIPKPADGDASPKEKPAKPVERTKRQRPAENGSPPASGKKRKKKKRR